MAANEYKQVTLKSRLCCRSGSCCALVGTRTDKKIVRVSKMLPGLSWSIFIQS